MQLKPYVFVIRQHSIVLVTILFRTSVQVVVIKENTRYIVAFDPGKQNANSTTIARFDTFTYVSLNILNICTHFCFTKITFFD